MGTNARTRARTSDPAGVTGNDLHGPYGDDPKDQALIMAGLLQERILLVFPFNVDLPWSILPAQLWDVF